jgi:hypothetical protein
MKMIKTSQLVFQSTSVKTDISKPVKSDRGSIKKNIETPDLEQANDMTKLASQNTKHHEEQHQKQTKSSAKQSSMHRSYPFSHEPTRRVSM